MKPLEIDLQTLPFGRSALILEAPATELDIAEDQYWFHDCLTVELDAMRGEKDIALSGRVVVRVRAECGRCLERFEMTLRPRIALRCHAAKSGEVLEEDQGGTETVKFLPLGATRLDIFEDVRSVLLLDLPIRPLCSEGCRGICPTCGKDLNREECVCPPDKGDDRWAALRDLRRP